MSVTVFGPLSTHLLSFVDVEEQPVVLHTAEVLLFDVEHRANGPHAVTVRTAFVSVVAHSSLPVTVRFPG